MNARYVLLADEAEIEEGTGKLNAFGIFEAIHTHNMPCVHNTMALAMRMECTKSEGGKHDVTIDIVDHKNKSILPHNSDSIKVNLDIKKAIKSTISFGVVINIQKVKYDKPGQYRVMIYVDGRFVSSVSFDVILHKRIHSPIAHS